MERRHQERKEVSNLAVEISTGHGLYKGIVRNISYSGMVIDGVPPEVKEHAGLVNLTVDSNGQNYRLRAIPKWIFQNDRDKFLSLRIFSVPRNWFQFVDAL